MVRAVIDEFLTLIRGGECANCSTTMALLIAIQAKPGAGARPLAGPSSTRY